MHLTARHVRNTHLAQRVVAQIGALPHAEEISARGGVLTAPASTFVIPGQEAWIPSSLYDALPPRPLDQAGVYERSFVPVPVKASVRESLTIGIYVLVHSDRLSNGFPEAAERLRR